jgi:uncharacterized protein YdeI (YjbR/CyaY-like superfamily)
MSNGPIFFATPAGFRAWLEAHHATENELLVGYHKKGSGIPSITWPESVDEALCFGWIDGVRRSLDEVSYTIRFTPRKPTSNWSAVNIRRAQVLIDEGRMRPAGLRAFEARRADRSGVYSFEQERPPALAEPYERLLRANEAAWDFFQRQPPSYRKAAAWWVMSAKREETRRKRLDQLVADSAGGRTVPPLTRPAKRSP